MELGEATMELGDAARKALGSAVKKARKARGLSQLELAAMVGCGRPQISRIETGDRGVSFDLFALLCKKLGLDANDIVDPRTHNGAREELIASPVESNPAV